MRLNFWGVRGSFPVARPHALKLGGNTSCLELLFEGHRLIVDAGTGIRRLGQKMSEEAQAGGPSGPVHLLISHPHWDHIQGFPYFEPAYQEAATIHVHSISRRRDKLQSLFSGQQHVAFFPVPLESLPSRLEFSELEETEARRLGPFTVSTRQLNHPGRSSGFRIEAGGRVLAYLSDVAPSRDVLLAETSSSRPTQSILRRLFENQLALAEGADVVVYDTFFTPEEYRERSHWGHSTLEDGLEVCRLAGARNLFMFHHNPDHQDQDQLRRHRAHQPGALEQGVGLWLAAEGQRWRVEDGGISLCE